MVQPSDFLTIALLVALEGLLSADNAMVLAVLVLGLPKSQQKHALRYGIIGAFVFRSIATVLAVPFTVSAGVVATRASDAERSGAMPRSWPPALVRYIRAHAADYKIDEDRIGITGASAGGHLPLMQGLAGDEGDAQAKDPIDQKSSRPLLKTHAVHD